MALRLHMLVVTYAALCAGLGSPRASAQTTAPSPVEQYRTQIKEWRQHRPRIGPTFFEKKELLETREIEVPQGLQQVRKYAFKSAAKLDNLVMKDNTTGLVYPGALLWTQPLFQGNLDGLRELKNRKPIPVTLEGGIPKPGEAIKATFTFDGSFGQFKDKSQAVVAQCLTTGPRVKVAISEMKELHTALLKLGMSASYWTSEVSGSLHRGNTQNRSFMTLSIDQVYYSMVADKPELAGYVPPDLLSDPANATYILGQMVDKGEIAWVRKVDYGRRVLITISADASEEELLRALKLSGSFGGVSFQGSVDDRVKKTWSSMDVRAYVIGGKITENFINILTGNPAEFLTNVNRFLKETAEFDQKTGAVPVSFEVRYAADDSAVAVYDTAEYAGDIPGVIMPKPTPVTNKDVSLDATHAALKQGDWEVDSDDWTGVNVAYRIVPTADQRAVEMHLTMDVYELESNKRFDRDNTHIQSARTIELFRVPDGVPYQVANVSGELNGTNRQDFRDRVHGWNAFPNFGALRDIQVHVDGTSDNDKREQGLMAKISCTVVFERVPGAAGGE